MKLTHVDRVTVFYQPGPGARARVGRLALRSRRLLFEYDPTWIAGGLELSPIHLALRKGVVEGDPAKLDGLMGLFDDSLPDGWGRLLIDRHAAELGLGAASLTPLDRLTVVGSRTMGALVYEPEVDVEAPQIVELAQLARDAEVVLGNAGGADLERLIALGGSPKGARPKVLVQIGADGEIRAGARDIAPGATGWLVKFPAQTDDPAIASLEHAYFLMAAAAGLDVPRTQILGRAARRPGWFAIERFDRRGSARVHCHSLGGLLQLPHGYPALDYRDLLTLTRKLTRDEAAVTEVFRRACFNVLAHNRDDHSRNFAFLMDERGTWSPSPAYDLVFSDGPGGEHTMLVAGEGRSPDRRHLETLAEGAALRHASRVIDQVRSAVDGFRRHADQAGVPARLRNRIALALGAGPSR